MNSSPPGTQPLAKWRNTIPYIPLLAYVGFVILTGIIAYYSFWKIEGAFVNEKLNDLGIIADTKVEQITLWRKTQSQIGTAFSKNSLLTEEFDQWMRAGMLPNSRTTRLRQLLNELQYLNEYRAITLLDKQGAVRISTESNHLIGPNEMKLALQVMQTKMATFSDFHWNSNSNQEISICVVVPLTLTAGGTNQVAGAAILQINPDMFLYPLIQSWPSHLNSAEILLVRRDGDNVMYLNELRHNNIPELSLRIPLDTPNLPAAMAVKGETSAINGIDYRGIPVVAAMRAIPGTPWYMVAKADKDELFAPIYQLKKWVTYSGIAFTLIGGGLFFAWLKGIQARNNQLKSEHDAALEREMLLKHFEYLTKYASDNILVSDATGYILEANERTQESLGYTREELLRMKLCDLRGPNEDIAICNAQLEQLHEFGELRYETTVQRKNGTIFPVETCIRVIEAQGVKYLHSITRDITEQKRAEQVLRRQKNFTLQIIDTVPNLIFVTDAMGKFLLVNQAMANLHKSRPEELVGQTGIPINREQTTQHQEMDRKVIETRLPVEFFSHGLLDGKESWFHFTKVPMKQPDGTVHVLSIGADITERKLAEQQLQRQQNLTLQIIDSVPNLIFVTDAQGKFLLVSQFMTKLHQLKPDELVGKAGVKQLMNKEPASQHSEMDREVIKTQHPVEFVTHNFIGDKENWIQFTKVPMKQPDGSVYVLNIGVDITERKLAEQILRQQRKFTLQIIDTVPDLIFVTDSRGKFLLVNQAMAAFHGMKPTELVGKINTDSFLIMEQAEQHLKKNQEVLERRCQAQFIAHHFMDGKSRWFHFTKAPMEQPDGSVHILNIGVDITERKQSEEMRANIEHAGRLNIAGEMASGLAHELSQPLTACNNYLVGCMHRMKDGDWDREKLIKAVQLAQKQAERAGVIVNHLKNMVKKQGHEHTLVNINLLAKDVMYLLEDEIKREGISLRMTLLPLPQIMACKIEIEQVLHNLYKNAIEAMHSCTQRELSVSTRIVENSHILISVRDSGKGITPEEIQNLFNPFHTSKQEGLGLGLVLCRSFVENHGGRIWVNTECSAGTEFCFTLPVEINHE